MIFSISAVHADGNFTDLQSQIDSSDDSIEITQDYTYDNTSDKNLKDGIVISKDNFTVNGNGHIIDGNGQSRIFSVLSKNVIFNNLTLINGFANNGGAIFCNESIVCNNVIFENNNADQGGAIYVSKKLNLTDCVFDNNNAKLGASLFFKDISRTDSNNQDDNYSDAVLNESVSNLLDDVSDSNKTNIISSDDDDDYKYDMDNFIRNTVFKNMKNVHQGVIYTGLEVRILIANSAFRNITSTYGSALFFNTYTAFNISNTLFENLHANKSGGAIAFISSVSGILDNCTFLNSTSSKNGGAIYLDENSWGYGAPAGIKIKKSSFINCSSDFGGAIAQAGGSLKIENSNFTQNSATFDGGAIYASGLYDLKLENSTFNNNKLTTLEEGHFGSAVYLDLAELNVINTQFLNNLNNAIYCYDCNIIMNNSFFKGNNEAIRSVYTKSIKLSNNNFTDDKLVDEKKDSYFNLIKTGQGINLVLINNSIDVSELPSRFDSRDWGWVSSFKDQGLSGGCWCFSTASALESALLKSTGIEYNTSIQNMQKVLLSYSKYGNSRMTEAGQTDVALLYMLSWFGVIPEEYDTFDEFGKITRPISTPNNIHVQDAVILFANTTNITDYKKAILNYGSVTTDIVVNYTAPYFNTNTSALYYNDNNESTRLDPNHAVAIIGWDDNYSASNFLITPPGDGAWIIKNSYGDEKYDHGCIYVSYYDTAATKVSKGIAFPIINNESYTKNYQTDMGGELFFKSGNSYKNTYQSIGNDLISAVGTFFNKENEEYSFEIYVNDILKLKQNGSALFAGFNTIKLTDEIPVKTGDNFTVIMNTNSVPILNVTRLHFDEGVSFMNDGKGWKDLSLENVTAILKVYTKDLAFYTEDLVKIYKNESKFEANVGAVNETVTFEVNGVSYNRISDENGTAKLAVNLEPGNYTIKTTFNGTTVENTITVLPTLIGENLVKYFRNESQFYISLIDGEGNSIAGKNITMNIRGVFYNPTTNENGTAKLNINLAPGEYIVTAIDPLTGLKMSYNITVLPVLAAEDINMKYLDGTQFSAKLVDGKGNPLANAPISFNINGVIYNRYTNSSGIASLNIRLMAGEYIITSSYENGAIISNKITISS